MTTVYKDYHLEVSLEVSPAPAYNDDLALLSEVQGHLHSTLTNYLPKNISANSPLLVKKSTSDGRYLRVYINDCQTLAALTQSYFVGFIGEKKESISATTLEEIGKIDTILTGELPRYPFILAYVSLEQPDRYNFVNLVILRNMESLGQWKDSPFHRSAARELSPAFYEKARIHVGSLAKPTEPDFKLIRTSHYNFGQGQTSLASRVVH